MPDFSEFLQLIEKLGGLRARTAGHLYGLGGWGVWGGGGGSNPQPLGSSICLALELTLPSCLLLAFVR